MPRPMFVLRYRLRPHRQLCRRPHPPCRLTSLTRCVRSWKTANAARHDWIAQEGRQQRTVHGVYQRTADFRISTTDADATPMRLKGGGTHLGYQTHYVVDGGKRRIILGVLVTPGEVMENQPMLDLLWRARFRWKLRPRQVTGDTTYGPIENIQAMEDMGHPRLRPAAQLGSTNAPISGRGSSSLTPSAISMSVPRASCCAPSDGNTVPRRPSIARSRPHATPARSKRAAPPAIMAAKSTAISPKVIGSRGVKTPGLSHGDAAPRRQALPATGHQTTTCAILHPYRRACGNGRVWRWLRATT